MSPAHPNTSAISQFRQDAPRRESDSFDLSGSAIEADGLFLYYPRRASLAPKLRAFIEAAKETLARGQG
jgi:hypothetical protein